MGGEDYCMLDITRCLNHVYRGYVITELVIRTYRKEDVTMFIVSDCTGYVLYPAYSMNHAQSMIDERIQTYDDDKLEMEMY